MANLNKGEDLFLGIDIGAQSTKAALIDEENRIIHALYSPHSGNPSISLHQMLSSLEGVVKEVRGVAVCGTGADLLREKVGYCNELIATTKGVTLFFKRYTCTVVEIGAQTAKLMVLREGELCDFNTNTICAAGTGSFLEQQAKRLRLTLDEFGDLANRATHPARVAGRCSVFAKSDMIHLQQEACPVEDIIAGLCNAFVRNLKSSLVGGKVLPSPIIFIGGVSANLGITSALKRLWGLKDEELLIPEHSKVMAAIGAAISSKEERKGVSLSYIREGIKRKEIGQKKIPLSPLKRARGKESLPEMGSRSTDLLYLGVDVGSISTNLVVMNEACDILIKRYMMTRGRPVEVVKEGIREIYEELTRRFGNGYKIGGVCTTGSGRYLIAEILGADLVKNEITAQARAAFHIDPEVDTIFEIGGQDSKYISLEEGAIVDFEMNKVCAAGTGSFLEEQAEHLELDIESSFQDAAFSSTLPADLGERCTVFMETALINQQQRGISKEDLAAGLCYSIAKNYLQKVVQNKKIGKKIFFQGGVASNVAVKSAFENILGKEITVPPHNEVTGAWGCCLLAREHYHNTLKRNGKGSSFLQFKNIIETDYSFSSFECKQCPNHCLIHRVNSESDGRRRELYYGGRCERYERGKKEECRLPDLFREWEEKTFGLEPVASDIKVAIPRTLLFYELYPFFHEFFSSLGAEVLLSPPSRRTMIEEGLSKLLAEEPCFPVKLAHAHLDQLLSHQFNLLFLPSIINLASFITPLRKRKNRGPMEGGWEQSYACPYEQTLPYLLKSAFRLDGERVVVPTLHFAWRKSYWERPLLDIATRYLGASHSRAKRAISSAKEAFSEYSLILKKRGEEILNSITSEALVLVGRPYNTYDNLTNLNIPQKLREENKLLIPMDYLPYHNIPSFFPNMYWHYGQRILAAAKIIKENPNLFPIYLTNFGCGPDSFLISFFKEYLGGEKPILIIEVDEHSAPAGIITRIEAYLESITNYRKKPRVRRFRKDHLIHIDKRTLRRRIYIPYMSDHARALGAAMRACGVDAKVMAPQNEETLIWGRKYTSGRECYPCIITVGDMVRETKRADFSPKRAAFFLGGSSGPCRFGQYSMLQRLVLDELGLEEVPVYAPNQARDFYGELKRLGKEFTTYAWYGIVATDLLQKCLYYLRPDDEGKEAERIYSYYIRLLERYIEERRDVKRLLKDAAYEFGSLNVKKQGKPKVGIVGEIFVRANPFSNEDIISQIERLGAEVWVAPVYEWFIYRNFRRRMHAVAHLDIPCLFSTFIKDSFQRRVESNLTKVFERIIETAHEPTTKEVLDLASPYISCWIEGEGVLSVGKAVDFIKKGAKGVVNVMPFTCMPGTITSGLLKRIGEDHRVPILNIAYDGLHQANTPLRLEAFIHQLKSN
jgi:predicted CoA-substrate-specific enzyme activase